MKESLQPGLETTQRITVDTDRTIGFMGEDFRVYSTPSMVLDIERTCNTSGTNYRPACAQSRMPMDVMVCGWAMSLFQALQPASRMAS